MVIGSPKWGDLGGQPFRWDQLWFSLCSALAWGQASQGSPLDGMPAITSVPSASSESFPHPSRSQRHRFQPPPPGNPSLRHLPSGTSSNSAPSS